MEDVKIVFYVTGFGKFGDVDANPTTFIVEYMEKELSSQPKMKSTKIVEVAGSTAKQEVQVIIDDIKDNYISNSVESLDRRVHIVILHFGVNHMKKKTPMFQLEQNAFNEANFRIADELGWKPTKDPIDETQKISHRFSTDLNVKRIKDHLVGKGFDVCTSGDAGRFVCNYMYYSTLNQIAQLETPEYLEIHGLFVHVPKFEGIEESIQFNFSLELLDSIEEAIIAKDKKDQKKKSKTSLDHI